jgi:prepilin-type N-terminal cleavage/methylation domain
MNFRTASLSRRHSRGFTLVEIMVGVAIGLIGILAIFQAVAIWSRHTAATTSGGDAQVAGTLALFNIERDLKQAGHGFGRAPGPIMGCVVAATDTTPHGCSTSRWRRCRSPPAPAVRPTRSASSTAIRRSMSRPSTSPQRRRPARPCAAAAASSPATSPSLHTTRARCLGPPSASSCRSRRTPIPTAAPSTTRRRPSPTSIPGPRPPRGSTARSHPWRWPERCSISGPIRA